MNRITQSGVVLLALALPMIAGAAQAERVEFVFTPPEGAKVESVSLRGDMNGWGEAPMERRADGSWFVAVDLTPGEHQYKFFSPSLFADNSGWPKDMATALDGGPVDPTADSYADDGNGGQNAVRDVGAASGTPVVEEKYEPAPPLPDGLARIHYHRPKGDYTGWGLHVWEDAAETVAWTSPLPPKGRDPYGVYWNVRLKDGAKTIGFIIHKGDSKDPGPDMSLDLEKDGREIWLVSGSTVMHKEAPDVSMLAFGDLSRARAHWVDRTTIAWRMKLREGDTFRLHSALDGDLTLAANGVAGGEAVALTVDPAGLSKAVLARFPQLAGSLALKLPEGAAGRVPALVKGRLGVSVVGADGRVRDATGLQIPGVLDDVFAYDGPLGVTWHAAGAPTISVWAPTAQMIRLHLFDSSQAPEPSAVLAMAETNGAWSIVGRPDWKWKCYQYEVTVYTPSTGKVEQVLATDPYSRSLSMNSKRTQIVDLNDPALVPEGWGAFAKPTLEAPEDIVIYELHVRDFSANDPTVPSQFVGTYKAFTGDSNGTRHLKALADAGLTHVHLLPCFDIASIDEDKSTWESPGDLSGYPPDSDQQQAAVGRVKDRDAYNWGYDPFHYGVPEGSYSTDPDGPKRILEFRELVKALSGMGLRVIMDVVYNHTNASGLDEKSVLDKIVPGYYHRLNADGGVETSTCCQNTATEHVMMERLMVDDLVHWARDYKVDGFRFDIMGHHMKRNMEKARDALHALTLEKDGVDGEAIYLYGEGWDFGEVQGGKLGVNATQLNLAGTGIGSFNDRLRDAVRGGSVFSDRRDQGFATGLFYDPNGFDQGGAAERAKLLNAMDRIRIGMTGNLREYLLVDSRGREVTGAQLEGVGYALDPQEAVNYVSAHDNETFFDKVQYAAPAGATLAERVRMENLALAVVALGQGVPFFHAGDDMLRSKSMETDSYNAGDWFNRIDWGYESNNFGVGLPSADKNKDRWNIIRPLLARRDITPGRDQILAAVHHFQEMLRIRKSSPLFRLRTGHEVQARVRFMNIGADQIPGLIVMWISDEAEGLRPIDPNVRSILVFLNATKKTLTYRNADWRGAAFALHPVQQTSHDEVVKGSTFDAAKGEFSIPARTAAVFLQPE